MKKNKALTLVELLIASSIFVIVMVTIYSAFHSGIFGYRNIDENINIYQTARSILERINLDLRNSFTYSTDESKFEGENNRLGFLTLVDSYREENIVQDYAYVSYKLGENKFMRLCRKNQEAINDKSETEPEEMASDIDGINFSYGYIDPADKSLKWKESWDNLKALPIAVRVKLTLKNKTKQEFERIVYLPLADIK